MEEIWRDIIITKNEVTYDYTGLYQVSNLGRVRSCDRVDSNGRRVKGRIMKLRVDKSGYLFVGLCKNGEQQQLFSIHRLVATAFIPNPDNLPVVNHKNELKHENVWTNLEWCTDKYNTNYGTAIKRRSKKMKGKMVGDKNPRARKVICLETKQIFGCIKDASEWLGKGDIKTCLAGRTKSAGGHHWMYLDDYKRQLRKQSDINNSKLVA